MARKYMLERNRQKIGRYNILVPRFLGLGWRYANPMTASRLSLKEALVWIVADSRITAEVVTPKKAAETLLEIIAEEDKKD